MTTRILTLSILSLPLALGLVACGDKDDASTRDDTTVGETKKTSTANGVVVESEMSAVVSVRGCNIEDDGSYSPDDGSQADVSADGSFTMEVESDQELYLVEGLDSDGEVVGMAVLEFTAPEGEAQTVTPMDSESTIEAATWLELIAEAGSKDAYSFADVRERIGGELSSSLMAEFSTEGRDGEDFETVVDGIMAAQEAELMFWSDWGATMSQGDAWSEEASASVALSESLYTSVMDGESDTDAAYEAHQEYAASVMAEMEAATGLSAVALSEASTTSWMVYNAAVEARVGSDSSLTEGVELAWGEGQATRTSSAVVELMTAFGGGASSDAENAGEELEFDAYVATKVEAMADAWQDYRAVVVGSSDSEGYLEGALGIEVLTQTAYDSSVDACSEGAFDLYTSLIAEAATSGSADGYSEAEIMALAEAGVMGWADYRSDAESASTDLFALIGLESQAEAALSILIASQGSYRTSS